ncbi:dephospho-CoA kinase, partial [Acinetobacter baumannii]
MAVGKSFVASVLGQLGCHVIDADEVARAVVAPGSPGLQAVVREFGRSVLRPDGSLDRARLAAIVLADAERRAR